MIVTGEHDWTRWSLCKSRDDVRRQQGDVAAAARGLVSCPGWEATTCLVDSTQEERERRYSRTRTYLSVRNS